MFNQLKKELQLDSNHFGLTHNPKSEKAFHDFIEFNKLIGMPRHPVTGEPTELMQYQLEFFNLLDPKGQQKFHINKSRQIGVTELILRVLAYNCFNKYKGGKILIITGTREKTAAKIMSRLKQLFQNIPETINTQKHVLKIRLQNGTEIEALPSNSDAIRGDTKIDAIFVDEAAHFDLSDDSTILDAIQPIVFTNKADLYLVSTPNGPRGFFYHLVDSENDYIKCKYDYTCAIGYIYSKEEIETELKRKDIDVNQEYCCEFTRGRGAFLPPPFIANIETWDLNDI